MTVAMITHQAPGDTFWDIIRKGAEAASAKDNVELQYSNDPDATKQAQLIQAAIDKKVDGIAVTDPNSDPVGPVRSARTSDVDIMGNFGVAPLFANSGGNRGTMAAVDGPVAPPGGWWPAERSA